MTTRECVTRVLRSRWFVLAACIWLESINGGMYDVGVYSQQIKDNLEYDQEDLDMVSTSKDIGGNLGIISGFLYEVLPPWALVAIAGIEGFFGYFMIWLSASNRITKPALWQMCLYMGVAANSVTFLGTAVLVTCLKIFPMSKGKVVGLMQGFLGISGAMLVQIYQAIYAHDQISFLLLMSWLVPLVSFTFMPLIQQLPAVEDPYEKKCFDLFAVTALILASYLLGIIVLETFIDIGRSWEIFIALIIFFILLLPAWVAVKAELQIGKPGFNYNDTDPLLHKASGSRRLISGSEDCTGDPEVVHEVGTCHEEPKLGPQSDLSEIDSGPDQHSSLENQSAPIQSSSNVDNDVPKSEEKVQCHETETSIWWLKPERGENFTLFQAVQSEDFWMIFCIIACGIGSGVTTINNMSQLGSSLDYSEKEISTFISLLSIWSFLGRFAAGYISDIYLHAKGTARPWFLVITLAVMAVGHIAIAVAFPGCLYLGSVVVGICYGAQMSLMPATTSELFGLQHFGITNPVLFLANPIASYILSVKVAGYFYDLEAEKQMQGLKISHAVDTIVLSESLSCSGPHCFRLTFFIMAGVSLLGCTVSSILFFRTRKFYKVQVHARFLHGR